ncbi:MAG: arsenate reductase [Pseudomonadota bacterium]
MAVVIHGIRNCDTMKKAQGWLNERGVPYAFHDYRTAGVEAATLRRWADAAGWETLLNRSGTTFRGLPEADRRDLDADRAIALMLAHPAMIKRPVLEVDGALLVGFRPEAWADALG